MGELFCIPVPRPCGLCGGPALVRTRHHGTSVDVHCAEPHGMAVNGKTLHAAVSAWDTLQETADAS